MRYRLCCVQLVIGIILVNILIERPSTAQDPSGVGQGYAPMTPTTTATPSSLDAMRQSTLSGAPVGPTNASRPASWPSQAAAPVQPNADASPWVPPTQSSAAPASERTLCDGTRIIARVGSEAIFESEVAGAVNEVIEKNKDRIPPDQLDRQRELLIQQRLKPLIEAKLIFQEARRTIPAEGWSQVEKQLTKRFEEDELNKLIKKAGVTTPRELDQHLRTLGTSLEYEKRAYIERTLAQQWVFQQVKPNEETTYDQMVTYYREHLQEFTTPARVQWEELMVRYSKYPTKAEARDAIARMGNQVFGGLPFAQVAKTGSDGVTANKGGQWGWTAKGSLANAAVDDALFNLPVGRMSPIIENAKGYYIVRVTQREEEAVRPFLEAQVDIKKKIVEQRTKKQFSEYMADLEKKTPVWTVFDGKDGALHLANPQQPTRR